MDWEIYPEGLYHFLTWLHQIVAKDLPIYVTENGMADGAPREDGTRIAYLNTHVAAARRAMAQGVPLKGYFIWSLMDNFEWALGYDKRFGMVHVDFETLERTPKASWHALRRAIGR
jgi:beta-glucosidase